MTPLDTPPQDLLRQALGLSCQVCLLIFTQHIFDNTPYATLDHPGIYLRQRFLWQGPNWNNADRFCVSVTWTMDVFSEGCWGRSLPKTQWMAIGLGVPKNCQRNEHHTAEMMVRKLITLGPFKCWVPINLPNTLDLGSNHPFYPFLGAWVRPSLTLCQGACCAKPLWLFPDP